MNAAQVFARPAVQDATLAQALDPAVLRLAWERVLANDGAAGWDGEGLARFAQNLPDAQNLAYARRRNRARAH